VQLHDGSWITLRALHHEEHDVTNRAAAIGLLEAGDERHEFLTGLIYIAPERADFTSMLHMAETPLALLPDEALRPGPDVLASIMESI
jgi:2-oxoglutarate ferredoxin oxidoreductase subunit beta